VKVTEKVGLWPVSDTESDARSMILFAGTVTFVHAGIAVPEEFFTVNLAEAYETAVIKVNVRHA
jgi:hypothetical protein